VIEMNFLLMYIHGEKCNAEDIPDETLEISLPKENLSAMDWI